MRIIIDTNVFLVIVSRRSKYHWLFEAFLQEKFELALSNEIVAEYEEQFIFHWDKEKADNIITAILEAPNSIISTTYFHFNLITNDPDDNKFVDCAVAVSADYLVTFDNDFNLLKGLPFPKINVVHPDEFKKILGL